MKFAKNKLVKNQSIFNWSGGKDSTLALHYTINNPNYKIKSLLTSVNQKFNRVSMHGTRRELLKKQAESIGIPLFELLLPENPSMEDYNLLMENTWGNFKSQKITHSIFGDIFLEDLKEYREKELAKNNIKTYFPLWKKNTQYLIDEFLDLGYKTIIVCTNEKLLGNEFIGEIITKDLIKELPKNVDVCGENGEFHTFAFEGPIFKKKINFSKGEIIKKTYDATEHMPTSSFYFCDLLPK